MVAILDPKNLPDGYSFDHIRMLINQRVDSMPIFKRRLIEVPFRLGHPIWIEDPEFDIDNHLHFSGLPAPGGVDQLAEFAADVSSRKLDRDKPLWEMWIVEGLQNGRFALVAKIHHSTIDGVTGTEMIGTLFDLEPTPTTQNVSTPTPGPRGRIPSEFELMSQALVARAVRPIEIGKTLWQTGQRVLDVRQIRQHTKGPKATLPLTAPRTSINTALGTRRRVAFATTSLAEVKLLKNQYGTTVNDVVLAVCAGALRSYLLAREELPDASLVGVIPIAVSPDSRDLKGSNKVSAMFAQLPTHEADPIERLQMIHKDTKEAKQEHSALGPSTLQNWAEHATPNMFAIAARVYAKMKLADKHRPIANLMISNMYGPDFPIYLDGTDLLAMFPLGPVIDGMGLNITIISYRETLCWGLIACARAVPQLSELANLIPKALEELLESANLKQARSEYFDIQG